MTDEDGFVELLEERRLIDEVRGDDRLVNRRLRGRLEVLFVTPDYYAEYPKSCMDGWGRRFIVVNPEGLIIARPR